VQFVGVLGKLEKFNRRLSGWFEWIAVIGLLAMMSITCIDVVGAKAFSRSIPGSVDIVTLSQIVAIFFAVAFTQIMGRHVRVEFFVSRLPERAREAVNSIVSLILIGLFALIIWRSFVLGQSLQASGQVSNTARVPLYPFAYGMALASIPVCLVFFREFLGSLAGVVKR